MPGRWRRRGSRFWLFIAAALALAFTYARPTLPVTRNVFHYLFLVDITQSMNARDYHVEGMPVDRLSFTKEALRRVIHELPCGSRVGLGVFSTKNIMLLFEPIEVCRHFAVIDGALAHVDWRMAWAADSNIERGLYAGIQAVNRLGEPNRLVFLTDGEQTVTELHRPPLAKVANSVRGLIVGVGGLEPTPLPKLDQENRMIGYWQRSEVKRPASDPGNAAGPADTIYRSRLNETELKRLAGTVGLTYHRLQTVERLSTALRAEKLAEPRVVVADMRWLLGMAALVLLVSGYVPDIIRAVRRPAVARHER